MNDKQNELRDRLLAQQPAAQGLDDYRKEINTMLEHAEKRLRTEKWITGSLWIFLVITAVILLVGSGQHLDSPKSTWMAVTACIWLLYGGIEVLKYFMNRYRVELLKEIKHLHLEVRELREMIQSDRNKPGLQ